ncbi:hypothetical protein DesyoDRAFT_1862 [Desulfosporosinus youngiae DSM 17734]|jgi:hypothetical protein|uniref:Uncharacterized protein n=1 Tax=Desulfosporosinus youngiae DSM 17734 TaxID=768710 RepID=H5XU26_9FIRM|nr:hypothetical protein DesyoDRAFT_1862 [Desulfosporosinus youngiae DSM 17734]
MGRPTNDAVNRPHTASNSQCSGEFLQGKFTLPKDFDLKSGKANLRFGTEFN